MRILIDCSLVHFKHQPSGIPRVVFNYVREGRRWGQAHGIEVVPVVCDGQGRFSRAGMRPGSAMPMWREAPRRERAVLTAVFALRQVLREVGAYAQGVVDAAVQLLCAVFRSRHARPALEAAGTAVGAAVLAPFRWTDAWYLRLLRVAPGADDVLFMPAYWHDLPHEVWPRLSATCRAVVVLAHDLLPITHPQFYDSPWRDEFFDNTLQMLRHASGVLAISGFTRDAVQSFARDHALTVDVGVAYNGLEVFAVHPTAAGALRADLEAVLSHQSGTLLMVSTLEPKKGHRLVLDAMDVLWAQGDRRALLIVGRQGWMCEALVQRIRCSPHLGQRLFWFDDLTDADLAACYARAQALVFASDAEGFGLPMIEAATQGCPVLALDTPVVREILGVHGRYFERTTASLAAALLELKQTGPLSRQALANFRWPTWQQTVPQVMDTLLAHVTEGRPLSQAGAVSLRSA